MIILYVANVALDWQEMSFGLWDYLSCNECVWIVPGTEIDE